MHTVDVIHWGHHTIEASPLYSRPFPR